MILTAVALLIVTPLLTTPLVLISLFTKSGRAVFRIAVWWAWTVHKCMGLTFSLQGTEKVEPGTSYIVTPNHQGNADILALFAMLPLPFRWVIKKELLRIPVFGWALAGTGAISLDRSNREKSVRSLKAAKKKLEGGWSVLIYPEGTRSSDPNLQPFKKGAFMMAVQTGVPILPVTCNGAYRVLPRKTITFIPGHITVTIGDPIQTQGLTEQDVPELMERTRHEIAKSLDPEYNPFDVHKPQPSPPVLSAPTTPKEN
jgi:1-acyl-sn-glycerol-3-phosphate acyltransferase